jgi:hypothetical protein
MLFIDSPVSFKASESLDSGEQRLDSVHAWRFWTGRRVDASATTGGMGGLPNGVNSKKKPTHRRRAYLEVSWLGDDNHITRVSLIQDAVRSQLGIPGFLADGKSQSYLAFRPKSGFT